jgi:hypothetical protein
MKEGRQKSKRLSYMAKFKREVIRCAEDDSVMSDDGESGE